MRTAFGILSPDLLENEIDRRLDAILEDGQQVDAVHTIGSVKRGLGDLATWRVTRRGSRHAESACTICCAHMKWKEKHLGRMHTNIRQ
jgi:hypothetical protein